jgi:hypothetical protein
VLGVDGGWREYDARLLSIAENLRKYESAGGGPSLVSTPLLLCCAGACFLGGVGGSLADAFSAAGLWVRLVSVVVVGVVVWVEVVVLVICVSAASRGWEVVGFVDVSCSVAAVVVLSVAVEVEM